MKKDGKYRFNLQFASDTEEQIQAGDLLERLGNKKSTVVIAALSEYVTSHPEMQDSKRKIEVKITSSYNKERIEQIIRTIVEEKVAVLRFTESHLTEIQAVSIQEEKIPETLETDVAQMLDNLNLFL